MIVIAFQCTGSGQCGEPQQLELDDGACQFAKSFKKNGFNMTFTSFTKGTQAYTQPGQLSQNEFSFNALAGTHEFPDKVNPRVEMAQFVNEEINIDHFSGNGDSLNDQVLIREHGISETDRTIEVPTISAAVFYDQLLTMEISVKNKQNGARLFTRILGPVVLNSEGQQRGIIFKNDTDEFQKGSNRICYELPYPELIQLNLVSKLKEEGEENFLNTMFQQPPNYIAMVPKNITAHPH
ncbi:hypothetical protein Ciccas_005597 [Cichlidogyrus casuarinus]|uniref:Uncharacterized protein n=1 Tax=Cichlidogyrus casuarinus TaxID=1844966 RepID=A0ABD2Q868_9PLAT